MCIRDRSNGIAVNVSDEEILAAQRLLGRTCGVFGEPDVYKRQGEHHHEKREIRQVRPLRQDL